MVDCDSASHPLPSLHEGISSLSLSSPLSLSASLLLLLSICHSLLLADIRLRPVFDNLAKITLSLTVSRILYRLFLFYQILHTNILVIMMFNIQSLVILTTATTLISPTLAVFDASSNSNMAVYWVGPR